MVDETFIESVAQERIDAEINERIRAHQATIARMQAATEVAQNLSVASRNRPFVMLSGGDSWFDYPLTGNGLPLQNTDIIAQLQTYGDSPITVLNLAHHGETSTDAMSLPKQERMIAALRDKANWIGGKPHAILFSAGGNDVAGDQFCIFLDFNDGRSDGLNAERFQMALNMVEASYLALFLLRDKYAHGVPIFAHSYDFPIPNGKHPSCAGPWLKPSLDFCNWSVSDGRRIAREALEAFKGMLVRLANNPRHNFHLIDTQGTLKDEEWANELHPGFLGFRKITKKFYDALTSVALFDDEPENEDVAAFLARFPPYEELIAREASEVELTARAHDAPSIPQLIENGSSAEGLAKAWKTAQKALPEFPHNGCAAHLSALLIESGIDIPMTLGAGNLARRLSLRGWERIKVGSQKPGDVGVTYDLDPTPPGADHIYLVIEVKENPDNMLVADNQRKTDAPHPRSASGRSDHKTPTEYFLRAT